MRLRLTLVVFALLVAGGASQERALDQLVPTPPPGFVPDPLPEPERDPGDALDETGPLVDEVPEIGVEPDPPTPRPGTPEPYHDPDCPEATADNALACHDYAGDE